MYQMSLAAADDAKVVANMTAISAAFVYAVVDAILYDKCVVVAFDDAVATAAPADFVAIASVVVHLMLFLLIMLVLLILLSLLLN